MRNLSCGCEQGHNCTMVSACRARLIADEEQDELRAEIERLRADNASLVAEVRRLAALAGGAEAKRVGCERDDGTLNVHAESETCEVCRPSVPASESPVLPCDVRVGAVVFRAGVAVSTLQGKLDRDAALLADLYAKRGADQPAARLACRACGADRATEPCRRPIGSPCDMVGVAFQTGERR